MSFYSPLKEGPDIGGGIQELMNQFMMMKLISEMYPRLEEGAQGEIKKNPMFEQFLHGTGINPGDGNGNEGDSPYRDEDMQYPGYRDSNIQYPPWRDVGMQYPSQRNEFQQYPGETFRSLWRAFGDLRR